MNPRVLRNLMLFHWLNNQGLKTKKAHITKVSLRFCEMLFHDKIVWLGVILDISVTVHKLGFTPIEADAGQWSLPLPLHHPPPPPPSLLKQLWVAQAENKPNWKAELRKNLPAYRGEHLTWNAFH